MNSIPIREEHTLASCAIAVTSQPLIVGRGYEAELRLPHPTVSRKHATLCRAEDKIRIEDHDSRFGTFVNGMRIASATAAEGDLVQFGSTYTFRITREGLVSESSPNGFSLAATGISIFHHHTKLVESLTFHLAGNSFVGILGPSGAGKSTLLNCLAGYIPGYEGSLQIDGRFEARDFLDQYRLQLGHIPQDDEHLRTTLTVRETLEFAADLRGVQSPENIDDVLQQLGLSDHSEKRTNKISGGQRRRLSVGFELLKRPRLLLLDEPTSGLDPGSESQLMERLRQIANRGTTVVCTTHLTANLGLFDQLIVLGVKSGVGRLAYDRSSKNLLADFECREYADLYERLSRGDFKAISASTVPAKELPSISHHLRAPGDSGRHSSNDLDPRPAVLPALPSFAAAINFHRVRTVAVRNILTLCRDRGLVTAIFTQPIALGTLACATQFGAANVVPLLFFSVVICIWLGMNNSVRELVRERRLFIRDRIAGLRAEEYLTGKWIVFLAVGVCQILLLRLILSILAPRCLPESVALEFHRLSLWNSFLALSLSYAGGMTLGLVLSTIARTEAAAVAILPLAIMPQLMISLVATGLAAESPTRARPFRPVAMSFSSPRLETKSALFLDLCSAACFSRPATLVWEAKSIKGHSSHIWILDLLHLVVLDIGTTVLLVWLFRRREGRWLKLLGTD